MKIWTVIIISTLAIVFLMAGCNKKVAQSQTPVRVGLVTWIGYGPFYIAQENGYYKENGIEVELKRIEGDAERRAALVAGDLECSAMTLDNMIMMRSQGVPIKTMMAIDASLGGDGIVAKQEIKTIEDLKGKQIAFPTGLPSHFFLYSVLAAHNMKMSEIEPIVMDADKAGSAFIAGQVDAAVTWEPWLSKARESTTGHVLIDSKEQSGDIEDVLFVREDIIKGRPEALKALIKSWYQAVDFIRTNPDSAVTIIGKAFGLSRDEAKNLMPKVRYEGRQQNKEAFGLANQPGFLYPLYDKISNAWLSEKVISKRDKPEDGIYPDFVRSIE